MSLVLRASFDRLARRYGDGQTITLRRRQTLENAVTGQPCGALAAVGAQLLGATSLLLDATSLRGRLVAGAQLTVAGHAAAYTVDADAEASGGQLTVALTSGLSVALLDNEAVTISQDYGDHVFVASRGIVRREVSQEAGQETQERRYHLSAVAAPTTPEQGDVVVDGTERKVAVVAVRERRSGATVTGWTIELGDAA